MIELFHKSKYSVTPLPDAPSPIGGRVRNLGTDLKVVASRFHASPAGLDVSFGSHPDMSMLFQSAAGFPPQFTAGSPRFAHDDMRRLQYRRMDTIEKLLSRDKVLFTDPGAAVKEFASLRKDVAMQDPTGKNFKEAEKKMIALLASHLVPEPGMGRHKQAAALYGAAVVRSLNERQWSSVTARFDLAWNNGNVGYISRMTPAAQMKLGEHNIFTIDYAEHGVSSGSSKDTGHASNLWLSEFHVSSPAGTAGAAAEQPLFRGVRHGINSAYGLKPGAERTEGALNRAREVVTAALYLDRDKLHRALAGEMVDLRISSTSLVTAANFPGLSTEGAQFEDQRKAWETLSKQSPCALQIRDEEGTLRDVRINLEIAVFNFGVNEAALNFKVGWDKSDKQNLQGLQQLLGDDLHPGAAIGGWAGNYLYGKDAPKNAALVEQLSGQIREIWQQKSHRSDGGEPYKLAQRIALLSNAIGVVPCYNCKSGKDRTGMLDGELKRELVQLHGGAGLSTPGEKLTPENRQLFEKILANSGNFEIQVANTGAPGNKVMHKHPGLGYNFSERLRVGDAAAIARISGLSSLV